MRITEQVACVLSERWKHTSLCLISVRESRQNTGKLRGGGEGERRGERGREGERGEG